MKKALIIFNIALVAILSSCAVGGPIAATEGKVGSKVGESSYKTLFGLVISNGGDASIQKAAKNGGITKVATIDRKVEAGFFTVKYITIVTGE